MTLKRRDVLRGVAGGLAVAPLAAPRLARAAGQSTLTFIPQADLAILDPVWTTATVTRNHAFLVFDTLFGQDASFKPLPQMAEGASTEADGKTWTIKLRPGLMFHDNTPVLGRDCVASLQRWGKRDAFGQALMAATDEISAPDDSSIRFRLKKHSRCCRLHYQNSPPTSRSSCRNGWRKPMRSPRSRRWSAAGHTAS